MNRYCNLFIVISLSCLLSAREDSAYVKSITPGIERLKEHIRYAKIGHDRFCDNWIHSVIPVLSGGPFLDGMWVRRWPDVIMANGKGVIRWSDFMYGGQTICITVWFFHDTESARTHFFSSFGAQSQPYTSVYRLGPKDIGQLCIITTERGGCIDFFDKNIQVRIGPSSDGIDTIFLARWISMKINKFSFSSIFAKTPKVRIVKIQDRIECVEYLYDDRKSIVFHCKIGVPFSISMSLDKPYSWDSVWVSMSEDESRSRGTNDSTGGCIKWTFTPIGHGSSVIGFIFIDQKTGRFCNAYIQIIAS